MARSHLPVLEQAARLTSSGSPANLAALTLPARDGKIAAPSIFLVILLMAESDNRVPPPSGFPETAWPLRSDEMHDTQEEAARFGNIPLRDCLPVMQSFDEVDQAAIRKRTNHKSYTRVAATCGCIAVLAAIGELSLRNWPENPGLEAFLVAAEAASLFALVVVILTEQKYKWLDPRHRAELLRLEKFRFLITPSEWTEKKAVEGNRRKILEKKDIRKWLEEESSGPHAVASFEPASEVAAQTLGQLIEYYLAKRLGPQKEYLENGIAAIKREDKWPRLAPRLFQFSVGAAFLHLLFGELAKAGGGKFHELAAWSIYAALAAACLPVISAGFRTRRSAFEYSRNISRFEMAKRALESIESVLREAGKRLAAGQAVPPDPVLKELWWCERILEIEHYEWLRLMVETEWYG